MGKMATYLMIMTGILLMMYYGGLITTPDTLLTLILNPSSISYSMFFTEMLAAIELIGLIGIVVVAVALRNPTIIVFGAVMIFLFDLGFSFLQVFVVLTSIDPNFTPLAILLFAPLLFIFGLTCIEWWGNKP